jgi:predicted small lipoprotein YifL
MKKLLCLLMAVALVFAFAACGGSDDKPDASQPAGDAAATAATSIKFDAESYNVGVDDYLMISEHVTVEPAGAKVVYSSSDETIAELSSVKGEFYGVKSGEVTVTAKSEDGKVTATCKLVVAGVGTVVARDGNVGGITNKRWGAVERPDDSEAYVVIIPKNLADADMSKAVDYVANAGEKGADGSCAVAVNGYFIAKTGDTGNYTLENVPEGDYVGIVISSMDYTSKKSYDKATAIATFKASAMGKFFNDTQIDSFVGNFFNREFYVGEFTVTANTNTVFGYDFEPDLHQ